MSRDMREPSTWLSEEERRRCDQLGSSRMSEFVAGRWLLRQLFMQHGLIGPGELVSITASGAPVLAGYPDIHLSLSHRAGWLVAGISDGPVGIDIEVVRPRNVAAMAGQVCSTREKEHLGSLPPVEALRGLHQIWALKEAAFKAGLSPHGPMDFRSIGLIEESVDGFQAMSWVWPDDRVMACVATNFHGHEFSTVWPGARHVQRWSLEFAGYENRNH
jgi:4'-phosphopantetheinyl transferase EntD